MGCVSIWEPGQVKLIDPKDRYVFLRLAQGDLGIMEKKMETTGIIGVI